MGLAKTIHPSGLFPLQDKESEKTLTELDGAERWTHNHPSFDILYGGSVPPGVDLLNDHIAQGFGELFESAEKASAHFGQRIHPAPSA